MKQPSQIGLLTVIVIAGLLAGFGSQQSSAQVCQVCIAGICDSSQSNGSCIYVWGADGPTCTTRPAPMCIKPRGIDDEWGWGKSGAVAPLPAATDEALAAWRDRRWQQINERAPSLIAGMLPTIESFKAAQRHRLPARDAEVTRAANVWYRVTDGIEGEGLDARLQVMPKLLFDATTLADIHAVEPALAWAVAALATHSLGNLHGQLYSLCLDSERQARHSPATLLKSYEAAAQQHLKSHSEAQERALTAAELAEWRSTPRREVYYDFEWQFAAGRDWPSALSIRVRDHEAAGVVTSGALLRLGYLQRGGDDPVTRIETVEYLTR